MKFFYILRITAISFGFCLIISCSQKRVIPAVYDAALFSNLPATNISGNKVINSKRGFGTTIHCFGAEVTYPVLYMGSSEHDSVKDAFVVGGFDLSRFDGKLKKAYLKLYLHHVSFPRKNIIFFIRPLKGPWSEETITYLDVYKTNRSGSDLTELVESDENKCLLVHFDSEATPRIQAGCNELPNSKGRTLSIDITKIVKSWLEHPGSNYGLLLDPMWKSDIRYTTTNPTNELTSFGIIEFASSEWYTWNGDFPDDKEHRWNTIYNRARGKIEYVPRLELIYTKK